MLSLLVRGDRYRGRGAHEILQALAYWVPSGRHNSAFLFTANNDFDLTV